jgi:hypothetical protein
VAGWEGDEVRCIKARWDEFSKTWVPAWGVPDDECKVIMLDGQPCAGRSFSIDEHSIMHEGAKELLERDGPDAASKILFLRADRVKHHAALSLRVERQAVELDERLGISGVPTNLEFRR